MKAALSVLLALVLLCTMTGCCFRQARANRCLFCQPTAQCLKERAWPPSQWCWGNCQAEQFNEELPAYVPRVSAGNAG